MARKQTSIFEDLISIASKLPPWLSLVIAVIFYFVFHYLATKEVVHGTEPGISSINIGGTFLRTISIFLQYLFPLAFVIGAIISFFHRRKGKRLLNNIRANSQDLEQYNWREFEHVVSTYIREQGFKVSENIEPGPDGGIDQILRKDGKKYLVQCKHWKKQKVGVSVVREMFGLMVAESASEVWIVTSGSFTQEANEFAEGKSIKLIDGLELKKLVGVTEISEPKAVYSVNQTQAPNCQKCGAPMVKRTARRGSNVGNQFWGCSNYPKCRYTVSL